MPDVPSGRVLAAAYDIGCRHAMGGRIDARDMASLPPGEHALWSVREVTGGRRLGCGGAARVVGDVGSRPQRSWPRFRGSQARARPERRPLAGTPGRDGAVLADGIRGCGGQRDGRRGCGAAARQAPRRRVAVRTCVRRSRRGDSDRGQAGGVGPWHGLPVFSAWVSEPEDATDGDGRLKSGRPAVSALAFGHAQRG